MAWLVFSLPVVMLLFSAVTLMDLFHPLVWITGIAYFVSIHTECVAILKKVMRPCEVVIKTITYGTPLKI